MGKIPSFYYIKETIESDGYELISTRYINAKSNLHMKCRYGHNCYISWNKFNSLRSRCNICAGNKKLTTEYVASKLSVEGYKLHNVYKNSRSRLQIECPKGHLTYSSWQNWREGSRCQTCKKGLSDELYEIFTVKNFTFNVEQDKITISSDDEIKLKEFKQLILETLEAK